MVIMLDGDHHTLTLVEAGSFDAEGVMIFRVRDHHTLSLVGGCSSGTEGVVITPGR